MSQKIIVFFCVGFLIASMVFLSGCVDQGGTKNTVNPINPVNSENATGGNKNTNTTEQCGGDSGVCTVSSVSENKTTTPQNNNKQVAGESEISFSDYFGSGSLTSYTATYEMTTKEINKPIQMKYYVKGSKMRMDMFIETNGEKSELRVYTNTTPGKIYTCMKIQESSEWMCFESKTPPKTGDSFNKIDTKDTCYKYDGTQTISNTFTKCFKCVKDDSTIKTCIRMDKPIFMLAEITKAGTIESKTIAKSIDLNEPADNVFELPAKPQDIENLMQGNGPHMPPSPPSST